MTTSQSRHDIVPFSPLQHQMMDWLELEHRQHTMHALLEVDITDARRAIREYRARAGAPLSLTAFLIYCLARAVDENRTIQALRLGRSRMVVFADVDVGVMVERDVDGARIPVPHIIRTANTKSPGEIQQEILTAKVESPGAMATRSLPSGLRWLFVRGLSAWLFVPAAFRRFIWTRVLHSPYRRKRLMGTVGVTSVGMFGHGTGWGIAPMAHPVTLVVGGLANKAALVGERVEEREYLCLTLTLDHDVIDGAPAARFAEGLKELIEGAAGLHDHDREPLGQVFAP